MQTNRVDEAIFSFYRRVLAFNTVHRKRVMKILILGAGKFGLRALKLLGNADKTADVTIVEKRRYVCMSLKLQNISCVCADGIDYLTENLNRTEDVDWIVPSIPVHVAFEWIKRKLLPNYGVKMLAVPAKIRQRLPNVMVGRDKGIYVSYADFICPAGCAEPDELCTFTGKPRPGILFKELGSIRHRGYHSIVVQSKQLAPGIGGYQSQDLFRALRLVRESNVPVLLSTACKCHGVMHALEVGPSTAV